MDSSSFVTTTSGGKVAAICDTFASWARDMLAVYSCGNEPPPVAMQVFTHNRAFVAPSRRSLDYNPTKHRW